MQLDALNCTANPCGLEYVIRQWMLLQTRISSAHCLQIREFTTVDLNILVKDAAILDYCIFLAASPLLHFTTERMLQRAKILGLVMFFRFSVQFRIRE